MSALNPPKSISRKHELREDKVVTFYARAWEFFDRNRKLVYGAIGVLVLIVAASIAYVLYQNQQGAEAEQHLARIVSLYEEGSYREALDGTADRLGLLEIAEDYSGTQAGNLAHFYAADALYQLGEFDRALTHFRAFDKSEDFIGASALAGQAAVHENRGEYAEAGELYEKAATLYENPLSTPRYLVDAGRAYELAGMYDEAMEVYETVRAEYPDSDPAGNIEIFIARAAAKQQS